ncbi:MAG: hypothetical protein B6D37_02500 [Sphingobacteriales bacterium UTBCD1]|nr:MAG: hypothetical protein B6D37_02500 [Sphingobacteriales bacterium UTBCD1]
MAKGSKERLKEVFLPKGPELCIAVYILQIGVKTNAQMLILQMPKAMLLRLELDGNGVAQAVPVAGQLLQAFHG